jgi:glycerol-3-phosphate cytidylyltransferase-like family protein
MATQVWAAPKLVVEDGAANPVFSVEDTGATSFTGADANNAFSYKIIGHTGGSSHAQTATDLADSRLTVMAAEAIDFAPRLQMTGPQDVVAGVRGWMIFDYGSALYPLPDARFVLRHMDGTGKNGFANIMETVGRQSISFPVSNVGIGTTTPTHLIHLGGGAYSDGATWVNASSRELKKDIQEVSAAEALKTVESLKPVSFVYKEGNQDMHVGFIAEDVPDMVATDDRKGLESMDIAAVLTKVVQEQQRMLKELQGKIVSLENALQLKKDKDINLAMGKEIHPSN